MMNIVGHALEGLKRLRNSRAGVLGSLILLLVTLTKGVGMAGDIEFVQSHWPAIEAFMLKWWAPITILVGFGLIAKALYDTAPTASQNVLPPSAEASVAALEGPAFNVSTPPETPAAAPSSAEAQQPCSLAETTARWLYLQDQNARIDAAWARMEELRPMIDHLLGSVKSYAPHPEIREFLAEWRLHINEVDRAFSEWLGRPTDIGLKAYSPDAQPIPRGDLSRDDALTYKKFYAQVSGLTTDGEFIRAKMRREEAVAREAAFSDARRIKFNAG